MAVYFNFVEFMQWVMVMTLLMLYRTSTNR